MAFDSTTFASDFADLFGKFADQQKAQNDKLVDALEEVGDGVGAKKGFKEKAVDYANAAQEKYLGGRPKTGPRQVKKAAIGVVIEDISKKGLYMAFNIKTPDFLYNKFKNGFQNILKSGEYQRLRDEFFK